MNFDVIIIDSAEALNRIASLARYRSLRGIAKALSTAGVLVMPREQPAGDWVDRLSHAGFSEASRLENWALFHPPASSVSQAGSRELTSYARSLEYRLSAVYRSSSWKAMAPVRRAGAVLKKKAPAAPIPKRPPGIEGKDPLKRWRSG